MSSPVFSSRRTLNKFEKKAYIDAVTCLQHLPAITTFEGVKTRFDDFQALHVHLTDNVHLVVSVLFAACFYHDD